MLERLRTQIGTAGLVVAIVALVAALGGGAYAATGGHSGKATASAKAKQGKQGKPGKTGPAGPAGAQGPAGPAGVPGPAGSKGDTGAAGTNGTNGKNGTTGFTETLPPNKTETGVWGTGPGSSEGNVSFPVSFAIPLAEEPETVIVPPTAESEPGCPGRGGGTFADGYKPTTPMAEPGTLCIYTMTEEAGSLFGAFTYEYESTEFIGARGASTAGTLLKVSCHAFCAVGGTWAVTGAEE